MEYTKEDYAKLFEKMRLIMADIGAVKKTGKHPTQGYAFVESDNIVASVRDAMVAHKIVFMASVLDCQLNETVVETKSGGQRVDTRAIVRMEMTLLDCETGCVMTAQMVNMAVDTSDKAVNKAITAAKKYWLLTTFMMSTKEDDSDRDSGERTVKNAPKSGDNKRNDKPAATPPQSPKNGTKSGFTPQGFEDFVRRWKSDIFTPQRIMEILGIQKGSDWKGTPDEADEALYLWRKEFEDNLPI